MKYNWQQPDWPQFKYDISGLQEILLLLAEKTGHINGLLKSQPEIVQAETFVDLMVSEAMKTSEIEGEYLSRKDVISSIRNQLGLNRQPETIKDHRAKGIAALMVNVHQTFMEPLSEKTLLAWHKTLLEHQTRKIKVGRWRTHDEAMQIVSGPIGKIKIHFEAPPSTMVQEQMVNFITWFNTTAAGQTNDLKIPAIRSAIAHLYFESIHPFEDGNGRIGRTISEKALSQGYKRPIALSLSKTIERDKKSYYEALKSAQRSNEITEWLNYFTHVIYDALCDTENLLDFILQKTKYFDQFSDLLNERQQKVIQRMLENGPDGFEGGMSAKKYIAITGASKATATRDLQYLVEIGALKIIGAGRSTRYEVNIKGPDQI